MFLDFFHKDCVSSIFELGSRLVWECFEQEGNEKTYHEPLREIVVVRDPPAVHVYNIMEHGRRLYMEQVMSTSDVAGFHTNGLCSTIVELDGVPQYVMGKLGKAYYR